MWRRPPVTPIVRATPRSRSQGPFKGCIMELSYAARLSMSEFKPLMHTSVSEAITQNVRVEVESQYAPEHSQPFQQQWFFHYTVRITNEGDETVQLLSR